MSEQGDRLLNRRNDVDSDYVIFRKTVNQITFVGVTRPLLADDQRGS